MPPITAAIRTPKAPTPPLSSAAGGLEKLVEPAGLAVLEAGFEAVAEDVELPDPAEDGVAELAGREVDPAACDLPSVEAEPALAELPPAAEELEDEDVPEPGTLELPVFGASPGFAVPEELEAPDEAGPAGLDALPVELPGELPAELPEELPAEALPVEELPVEEPAADAAPLPGLASTFSAFRSMVTGRLDAAVPEAVLLLSGFSEDPLPFPPEEDVPPDDLLSVAIYSPPDPSGPKTFTIHASLRSGTVA